MTATTDEVKRGGLQLPASQLLVEKSTTALNEWGGYIREGFLTELQGAPACLSIEKPRQRGKPVARGADR